MFILNRRCDELAAAMSRCKNCSQISLEKLYPGIISSSEDLGWRIHWNFDFPLVLVARNEAEHEQSASAGCDICQIVYQLVKGGPSHLESHTYLYPISLTGDKFGPELKLVSQSMWLGHHIAASPMDLTHAGERPIHVIGKGTFGFTQEQEREFAFSSFPCRRAEN